MEITVLARTARETDTGVEHGVDVDFTAAIDGCVIDGECTLLPRESSRSYGAWGQPDHWVDGRTLAWLRKLAHEDYRTALDAIEEACAPAAEAHAAQGLIRFMVIDPSPSATPAQCVRKVDMRRLPRYVVSEGVKFLRRDLRPRYYINKADALRDAAKRVIRDMGAPGGLSREDLATLDKNERAELRADQAAARVRYAHYLRS